MNQNTSQSKDQPRLRVTNYQQTTYCKEGNNTLILFISKNHLNHKVQTLNIRDKKNKRTIFLHHTLTRGTKLKMNYLDTTVIAKIMK